MMLEFAALLAGLLLILAGFFAIRAALRQPPSIALLHCDAHERLLWVMLRELMGRRLLEGWRVRVYTARDESPRTIRTRAKARFGALIPEQVEFVHMRAMRFAHPPADRAETELKKLLRASAQLLIVIEIMLLCPPTILFDTSESVFVYFLAKSIGVRKVVCYKSSLGHPTARHSSEVGVTLMSQLMLRCAGLLALLYKWSCMRADIVFASGIAVADQLHEVLSADTPVDTDGAQNAVDGGGLSGSGSRTMVLSSQPGLLSTARSLTNRRHSANISFASHDAAPAFLTASLVEPVRALAPASAASSTDLSAPVPVTGGRKLPLITVLYPPCDTMLLEYLPLAPRPDRVSVVLSLGSFRAEKNHELQLRAFARVLKAAHDAQRQPAMANDSRIETPRSPRGSGSPDSCRGSSLASPLGSERASDLASAHFSSKEAAHGGSRGRPAFCGASSSSCLGCGSGSSSKRSSVVAPPLCTSNADAAPSTSGLVERSHSDPKSLTPRRNTSPLLKRRPVNAQARLPEQSSREELSPSPPSPNALTAHAPQWEGSLLGLAFSAKMPARRHSIATVAGLPRLKHAPPLGRTNSSPLLISTLSSNPCAFQRSPDHTHTSRAREPTTEGAGDILSLRQLASTDSAQSLKDISSGSGVTSAGGASEGMSYALGELSGRFSCDTSEAGTLEEKSAGRQDGTSRSGVAMRQRSVAFSSDLTEMREDTEASYNTDGTVGSPDSLCGGEEGISPRLGQAPRPILVLVGAARRRDDASAYLYSLKQLATDLGLRHATVDGSTLAAYLDRLPMPASESRQPLTPSMLRPIMSPGFPCFSDGYSGHVTPSVTPSASAAVTPAVTPAVSPTGSRRSPGLGALLPSVAGTPRLDALGRQPVDTDTSTHRSNTSLSRAMQADVLFAPNLNRELRLRLLSLAAVGVHTVPNEQFGIEIVEMMAAGVPLVAHNSGCPRLEIVVPSGEVGLLARSEEEYAAAISDLLLPIGAASRRKRMAMRARKSAIKNFSEEQFARRLCRAMRPLLDACKNNEHRGTLVG